MGPDPEISKRSWVFGGTSPEIYWRWGLGGAGGQRQKHQGGGDRALGGPVTGMWAVKWPSEAVGDNRVQLLQGQGTVRDRGHSFPRGCLNYSTVAKLCSLLVCSPFKGGKGV